MWKIVAAKSTHAADNLYCLGKSLQHIKQWNEAEDCYRQALLILENAASKSELAGHVFCKMGFLAEVKQDIGQAIECWENAEKIFKEAGLVNLGIFVEERTLELRRKALVHAVDACKEK